MYLSKTTGEPFFQALLIHVICNLVFGNNILVNALWSVNPHLIFTAQRAVKIFRWQIRIWRCTVRLLTRAFFTFPTLAMINKKNMNGVEQNKIIHVIVSGKQVIICRLKRFHLLIDQWAWVYINTLKYWEKGMLRLFYIILFSWRWISTQSIKVQNGAGPPYIFKYLRWLWTLSLEFFLTVKRFILSCLIQFKNKKNVSPYLVLSQNHLRIKSRMF